MIKKKLSEIAKMYGVSVDSLKYWEKEGLISFGRDANNNYRKLSYEITERIVNIVMFRKLAIPIKELKRLPHIGLEDFDGLLNKNREKLNDKLLHIKNTIAEIDSKKVILEKIRDFNKNPFHIEKLAIKAIKPYYYLEEASTVILNDSYQLLVLIKPDNPLNILYARFTDENDDNCDLLRPADQHDQLYLKGLLKLSAKNMLHHNSAKFVEKAKELHFEPGQIIGRYLITLFEDELYDFYEAWIEIREIM